jgi:hypothetical protein
MIFHLSIKTLGIKNIILTKMKGRKKNLICKNKKREVTQRTLQVKTNSEVLFSSILYCEIRYLKS